MKRLLVVLAAAGLTAAGVWWAVTKFPRATSEPAATDSAGVTAAVRQTPVAPQRLVPGTPAPAAAPPATDASAAPALMEHLPSLGGACGAKCGTIRWSVKTLSDADRDLVRLVPVDATVEQLVALERPADLPDSGRAGPAELTVYRVRGYLAGWSPEKDGDIHVALFGLENQRLSLVTEIPDPACGGVCRSGLGSLYAEARRTFEAIRLRPNPEDRPVVLEITGVGFWDRREHASYAAANGIELHPVLQLREVSRQ